MRNSEEEERGEEEAGGGRPAEEEEGEAHTTPTTVVVVYRCFSKHRQSVGRQPTDRLTDKRHAARTRARRLAAVV